MSNVSWQDIQEISDVIIELAPLKASFPVLVRVLQISMTISVSSAKCERSFSTLKRIKTYLRSSMSEQRLTDLAVLSIERDISDSLDLENVVDAFAQKHKNSRIVLKYLFTAVCVIVSLLCIFLISQYIKH